MFKAEEGMLTLALMTGEGEVVVAAVMLPLENFRIQIPSSNFHYDYYYNSRLAANEAVWARHSRSAANEAVWALLDHLMITPELDQYFV